jgi:hypothetical protein
MNGAHDVGIPMAKLVIFGKQAPHPLIKIHRRPTGMVA